jgi:hypothetical protein
MNCEQFINGTFSVSSSNSAAYGVNFGGQGSGNAEGDLTIDGTFTIFSQNSLGYGVRFYETNVDSFQNINGTFTIFSHGGYGVYFYGPYNGNTTIDGIFSIFTIASDTTCGVACGSTTNTNIYLSINGKFMLIRSDNGEPYSVRFLMSANMELYMSNAQFFSSGKDNIDGDEGPCRA